MRRRRLHRMVALPVALWFVALATNLGGVSACPMQDAMAHGESDGAAMQMSMPMSMSMPMPMPMSMHATAPSPAAPPSPMPHGPMQCTCMGLCCGCTMATLPAVPVALVAPVVQVSSAVPTQRATRLRVAVSRYLLPPAIGPPAHSSI